ncbi:acetate--CoA ligase [Candidatus Dependentiae bacterium]|nr:acetate--CoA ligase [Candidatus Dependentiae bacterium]
MKKTPVISDVKGYWELEANRIPWFEPWNSVLEWNEPFAKWFAGGTLNASYACLDVHMGTERENKVAIHWEGEDGETIPFTYAQLYHEVNRFASALKKNGMRKSDRVVLYLPMIPQALIAMLACARLGAIHSVVFSAFGSSALADRIRDAKARFVITADFGKRQGKLIPIKNVVDIALEGDVFVEHVFVIKRTNESIVLHEKRDLLFQNILEAADDYVAPEPVDATHPLFILYTSGTTGKPKGIVHSTGGYLTYINSVFNKAFNPQEDSVYWCTADVGWITGHSFVTYAPLMNGTTSVVYEGGPTYPTIDRWWQLIEKYKISIFYTSPTALRMFMRHGTETIKKHDLSSLRVLGSVGEVINPEVWSWYHEHIGGGRCPIIDTWWQTETGGFMLSPSAQNLVDLKPGSATFALPGIDVDIVDAYGISVPANTKGYLVIKQPWPGMLIGVYGDPERYRQVYWSKFSGMYYPGDFAIKDDDGYFWLLGRSDEALNVAGHLLGTAEIESAAVAAFSVAEAAVVGVPDDIKGQAVVLFVTLRKGVEPDGETKREIVASIRHLMGPIAKPRDIYFVDSLPKTRSGKIMRRILKAIACGEEIGDVSTLENEASVEEVRQVHVAMKKSF